MKPCHNGDDGVGGRAMTPTLHRLVYSIIPTSPCCDSGNRSRTVGPVQSEIRPQEWPLGAYVSIVSQYYISERVLRGEGGVCAAIAAGSPSTWSGAAA